MVSRVSWTVRALGTIPLAYMGALVAGLGIILVVQDLDPAPTPIFGLIMSGAVVAASYWPLYLAAKQSDVLARYHLIAGIILLIVGIAGLPLTALGLASGNPFAGELFWGYLLSGFLVWSVIFFFYWRQEVRLEEEFEMEIGVLESE